MLFSAELPWCLIFVQKMNYQEKSRKICQKLYFTRRSTEPENDTERRLGGPTPTPGACPPLAAPGGGAATLGTPSASLCAYKLPFDLKTKGVDSFQKRVPLRRRHQKPRFGFRNSVLVPCRDGEFGE